MSPIGHCAVGLAAKPVAPKVSLGVLFLATWLLEFFAFALAFAGIEGVKSGIPWSHGLFMSVIWSVVAAVLAGRIYREYRAGAVVGLLVFSHWVLDLVSHPIPFSSFSWRAWQWRFGHPFRPTCHFFSGAHRKWDSACTTPSARLKPPRWSLECLFWARQYTQPMSLRNVKLGDHAECWASRIAGVLGGGCRTEVALIDIGTAVVIPARIERHWR